METNLIIPKFSKEIKMELKKIFPKENAFQRKSIFP
jgi:hypothetical protein